MNYNFNDDEKMTFSQTLIKEGPIWLIEIIIVVVVAFCIVSFGLEKTTMLGSSMVPVLNENDKIVINKMSYKILSPKRFDVIVFKQEGQEHSYYNIKRVIGLPGETIQIIDGKVYINGEEFKEKYKMDAMITGGLAEEELKLEKGEYFVLGDNRNQSEDSRYSNIGTITKKDIIGRAWIRIRPTFDFISWIGIEEEEENTDQEN